MDWSDWLALPEEAVVKRMKRRLNKPITSGDFIALYNGFIMQAEQDPRRIWKIGRGLTELMRKRARPNQALLFAELWARGALAGADLAVVVAALDAIRRMKIAAARDTALELADLILTAPERFGASQDQIPRALAAVTTVLHHYGEMESLALVHLEAAAIYSRHNATQAAYRSLSDAEEIARDFRSVELLGKVYAASLAVGFEEGDFEFALASGERALDAFKNLGSAVPPQLLANLAVVQMNADQYDEAIINFERALGSGPIDVRRTI